MSANGLQSQSSLNKALLLSALTIDANALAASEFSNAGTGGVKTFAAANAGATIDLSDISVGVFTRQLKISQPYAPTTERQCRVAFRRRRHGQAGDQFGSRHGSDHGRGHRRREHSDGEVQRLGSSLGRHAVPGELEHRRRTHAAEVTPRMSKKPHHFKNWGSRLPQPEPDGTADKEVRGINQTKSRRITPCHSR